MLVKIGIIGPGKEAGNDKCNAGDDTERMNNFNCHNKCKTPLQAEQVAFYPQ